MVATDEITASLSTAEQHLRDAQDAFNEGRYHDCAYHSASAAENSGNALILALGGRIPRTHRNADAIEFAVKRLKPDWLKREEFREMLKTLRVLETHIVKSRYPIKVKGGIFVSPNKYYTQDMSKDMLEKAILIVSTIKRFMTLL